MNLVATTVYEPLYTNPYAHAYLGTESDGNSVWWKRDASVDQHIYLGSPYCIWCQEPIDEDAVRLCLQCRYSKQDHDKRVQETHVCVRHILALFDTLLEPSSNQRYIQPNEARAAIRHEPLNMPDNSIVNVYCVWCNRVIKEGELHYESGHGCYLHEACRRSFAEDVGETLRDLFETRCDDLLPYAL